MDGLIDGIIAFLVDFKTLGPATKFGILAALVGLGATLWAIVRSLGKSKLRNLITKHDELVAEISERDEIIKEQQDEVEALRQTHPDSLLDEIEREERDGNTDLAVNKSDVVVGNIRQPLLKACRLLVGHHLSRAAGDDWQVELAAAERYATIGHALDPDDGEFRTFVLEIESANRQEADLQREFHEGAAHSDAIYDELSASGGDEVTLINSLFRAYSIHRAAGRYFTAGHLIRRAWLLLRRREGSNHQITLRALGNLGVCYNDQGRYEEA